MIVGRTGTLICPDCGFKKRQYVVFDELERGISCAECFAIMELQGSEINRSQVLMGQLSDNIESELYTRPDYPSMPEKGNKKKGDRARRFKKDYHIIEKLIAQGKTKRFSRAEMRMYKDRMANYEAVCGQAP